MRMSWICTSGEVVHKSDVETFGAAKETKNNSVIDQSDVCKDQTFAKRHNNGHGPETVVLSSYLKWVQSRPCIGVEVSTANFL